MKSDLTQLIEMLDEEQQKLGDVRLSISFEKHHIACFVHAGEPLTDKCLCEYVCMNKNAIIKDGKDMLYAAILQAAKTARQRLSMAS